MFKTAKVRLGTSEVRRGATPSLISWFNDVILLCFFLSWVLGYLLRKNMKPSIIAHVDNPNIWEAEAGGLL